MITIVKGEQIEILTGYKRAKQQAKWLDENGIRFHIDANGQVVTTRDWLNGWDKVIPQNDSDEFNMEFLEDAS